MSIILRQTTASDVEDLPCGFAIAHDLHKITSGCCGRVRRSVLP